MEVERRMAVLERWDRLVQQRDYLVGLTMTTSLTTVGPPSPGTEGRTLGLQHSLQYHSWKWRARDTVDQIPGRGPADLQDTEDVSGPIRTVLLLLKMLENYTLMKWWRLPHFGLWM